MRASRPKTLTAMVLAAGIVQLPTAAIVLALPTIHRQFDASLPELQWTVTAFLIPYSAMMIAGGRLADIFGRRRLLLIGTTLFAGGSALAAVSPGAEVLIAGIACAGAGGALLMPASMAILTNLFTDSRRGLAIGMWGAATELVSGAGVVVGGVLTGGLSWRLIFWLCVLFALVIVVLALRGSRESHDPTTSRHVDIAGVALSGTGLVALTLALNEGTGWGWGSAATVAVFAIALLAFVGFAVVERRTANPLVDFSFFKRRNFSGSMVVVFVMDFSFGALLFFLPLYFQELLGYSPAAAGALLLPLTGVMVVASPLGGWVTGKVGPRPPIVAGLGLMAVAVYLLSTVSLDTRYSDMVVPTVMMGFGVGFALTPMNLAAMNAVSSDHHGAASGLLVTLSGAGATLGVAVTGAIFQGLQTDRTIELSGNAGVKLSESQAQSIDGLLAGTPGAQQQLDRIAGVDAGQIEHAVRQAFVDALGTSLKLSAALVLAGMLLSLILIRRSTRERVETEAHVAAPAIRPAPRGAEAPS